MIKYYTVKIFYIEGVFILKRNYEEELIYRKRSKHVQSRAKHKEKKKKVMTDRKRRAIKRFNTLFIIAYMVFAIYRITAYFSWKSLALPIMKNECSTVVEMSVLEKMFHYLKCHRI